LHQWLLPAHRRQWQDLLQHQQPAVKAIVSSGGQASNMAVEQLGESGNCRRTSSLERCCATSWSMTRRLGMDIWDTAVGRTRSKATTEKGKWRALGALLGDELVHDEAQLQVLGAQHVGHHRVQHLRPPRRQLRAGSNRSQSTMLC